MTTAPAWEGCQGQVLLWGEEAATGRSWGRTEPWLWDGAGTPDLAPFIPEQRCHSLAEAAVSQSDPAWREQCPLKQAPGKDRPHIDPANSYLVPKSSTDPINPKPPPPA